jgi:hypothetical protein
VSALIIPDKGHEQEVAAALLSLADHPRDVVTNTDSGLAFVVPDKLADLYADAMRAASQAGETATRKGGRPKKEGS